MYKVEFSKNAIKSLKKFDKATNQILISWIENNLNGIENPRSIGKPLQGEHSDKWRYRKGDYRIIANIKNDKIIILIVDIGHRKEIYQRLKRN